MYLFVRYKSDLKRWNKLINARSRLNVPNMILKIDSYTGTCTASIAIDLQSYCDACDWWPVSEWML